MNRPGISSASLTPLTPELSDREFLLMSRLIQERSGIKLGESRRALIRARLGRRLRELGLRSYQDYYDYLQHRDPQGAELTHMLDAISTNLTEFYRSPSHFEYLRHTFFPRWSGESQIRILSAGCSTGEEPYSIAMSAFEHFGPTQASRVRVIAGDISTRVLARAKAGIYAHDRLQGVPPDQMRRYFLRGTGNSAGLVRVVPEVQALVSFISLNLSEPLALGCTFHAVFCRNVLIYFDQPTQDRVFGHVHRVLVPGGILFLGHSESMICSQQPFAYVEPTVYQAR